MMYFQITDWIIREVAHGNTTTARTNLRPRKFWLSTRASTKPMRVEKPTTTTVHTRVFCRVCQKVGEDKTSLKFSKLLKPFSLPARVTLFMDS